MAQENHPERYDFIAEARRYLPDGSVETWLRRESPYPGRCILHKPVLGDTSPSTSGTATRSSPAWCR
jgi:hypothetical protein